MSLASVGFARSSCQPGKETVSGAEIQSAAGPSPTEFLLFFLCFVIYLAALGSRRTPRQRLRLVAIGGFVRGFDQSGCSQRETDGREGGQAYEHRRTGIQRRSDRRSKELRRAEGRGRRRHVAGRIPSDDSVAALLCPDSRKPELYGFVE